MWHVLMLNGINVMVFRNGVSKVRRDTSLKELFSFNFRDILLRSNPDLASTHWHITNQKYNKRQTKNIKSFYSLKNGKKRT